MPRSRRVEARRRREAAAEKYRPATVNLLLVAEAPPAALDRYFYFEDVREQDALFRYTTRALLGVGPARENKARQLRRLATQGVFLVDLKPDPKTSDDTLEAFVPSLVSRAVTLAPRHVIVVKANVCDLTQEPLRDAGLNVVRSRVPFPGSGHQRRFLTAMHSALEETCWAPSAARSHIRNLPPH